MRIWLDPDKAAAYNLSAGDVLAALRAQNLQVSAGILNQPPAPSEEAYQINVEALGRLATPEQFGDIIVKSDNQGRVTRVRDIGRVEIGAADYGSTAYMDRSNAAALVIYAEPGANSLAVDHEVLAAMGELKKDFPSGVDSTIIYDPTVFISKSIHEVVVTIFVAILLVVGVVFLFLQNWRATIIPVIAIPVSLVGTFTILAAFGISLNNLSLFGLVLAVGIVVDDAIVVVENVERNLRNGMSPAQAAHRTMDEVGGALISIALTLCAVFVPSAFLSGISGLFFRQFAVTISASTVISCFVSLTLSPALCAVLFKAHHEHERARAGLARRAALRRLRSLQSGLRPALFRLRGPDASAGARRRHRARCLCGADWRRRHRVLEDADRLHPRAGSGLPHQRRSASSRRDIGPDREGRPARHRHHSGDEGRRACRALRRPRCHDIHGGVECGNDLFRLAVTLQSRATGRERKHGVGRSA